MSEILIEARAYALTLGDVLAEAQGLCAALADTLADMEESNPGPQPQPKPGLAGHYALHDISPGVNSTSLFYWSRIEPAPGRYNWEPVDKWLAERDRSILQVYLHTTDQMGSAYFRAWQPHGLPAPYLIRASGQSAVIPTYDRLELLETYRRFIGALGERYDGRVAGVVAVTGLDGEAQAAKQMGGVDWIDACYGTEANAVPYRFENTWVPEVLEAFARAFSTTPIFVDMAPGGTNMRRKVARWANNLGIGMKHSGLCRDAGNHWGYNLDEKQPSLGTWDDWDGEIGSWDPMRIFGGQVITESVHGQIYSLEQARDTLLAGLSYHPVAMVWHESYFDKIPQMLTWAKGYLGVTKETTPGVWWRKHESGYPFVQTSSRGGHSGHTDDWGFWLYRQEDMFVVDDLDLVGDECQIVVRHEGKIMLFGRTFEGNGTSTLIEGDMPQWFKVTGPVTFLEIRR